MNKIKKMVIKFLKRNNRIYLFCILNYKYLKTHGFARTILFNLKGLFKFYVPSLKYSKGMQMNKLLGKVKIKIPKDGFLYNLDIYKSLPKENLCIENTTIDYSKLLDNSLNDFKKINSKLKDSSFKQEQLLVIQSIEEYIGRIIKKIECSDRKDKKELILIFNNMINKKCSSTYEGFQRILFYNSVLWQFGYGLNGIGRLDYILDKYYKKDVKKHKIDKMRLKSMLKDFYILLHKNYWLKSNMLLGDTGQIIILGGKETNEKYFSNQITYEAIEALKELKVPDPKVFLRVSSIMPNDLLDLSLKCISTGIGSPLLSNDDVIIDKLINFGIDKADSFNYVTSACWEPLIVGKSVEQNNIGTFVFLKPLNDMLDAIDLSKIKTYSDLEKTYFDYLENSFIDFLSKINKNKWNEAPFHSMLVDGCNETLTDVSNGGGKYSNFGITTVSLGNTVNSLLNIKHFVFDEKRYKLEDLNKWKKENFVNNQNLINELKNQPIRYGTDEEDVVNLTNSIINILNDILIRYKTKFNTEFVFGLSSPSYITQSKGFPASLDGRLEDDPFLVHISSDKRGLTYTELINFASMIDYSKNAINGNVIDYMINPTYFQKNYNKLFDTIKASIDIGFYQMQLNVVSSEMLLDAKAHPENYKTLVVRVWGFSAYFNDLPDSYKDLLIERALLNEGKSY